jgi:hypothetical protein
MKRAKPADPSAVARAWDEVRSWKRAEFDQGPPRSDEEARRRERVARDREASMSLVDELRELGIPLESVWDLVNVRLLYPGAVPILVAALHRDYPEGVTEGILRALARPYGEPAFSSLISLAQHLPEWYTDRLKFALGLAIAANAEKSDLDVLLALVYDAKLGGVRDEIVDKIATWKDARIVPALVEYLESGSNIWYGVSALRRAHAWSHADKVQPYLSSPVKDHRDAAKQFIKAMARATGDGG